MLLTAKDVMQLLDISKAGAYNIIRSLNAELEAKGYLTLRGKVEEKYLYERYRICVNSDSARSLKRNQLGNFESERRSVN